MVIIGIIADTHISSENEKEEVKYLLEEIKRIFKDVDEIIHAGDVCEGSFLEELNKIAPTRCVKGNMDYLELEVFIRFSVGSYNIGVIHTPPDNFEEFFNKKNINILIHGHTHQPIIKGTPYRTLIINPGSPTLPKAPPAKRGFDKPLPRPTVIKLEIDEDDIIKTFIINIKT